MRFIYGTGNEHKKNQVIEMLKFKGIDAEILTLKDIGFDKTIIEDGKTFEENSLIKAIEIQKFCNENNIKDLNYHKDYYLYKKCSIKEAYEYMKGNEAWEKLLHSKDKDIS